MQYIVVCAVIALSSISLNEAASYYTTTSAPNVQYEYQENPQQTVLIGRPAKRPIETRVVYQNQVYIPQQPIVQKRPIPIPVLVKRPIETRTVYQNQDLYLPEKQILEEQSVPIPVLVKRPIETRTVFQNQDLYLPERQFLEKQPVPIPVLVKRPLEKQLVYQNQDLYVSERPIVDNRPAPIPVVLKYQNQEYIVPERRPIVEKRTVPVLVKRPINEGVYQNQPIYVEKVRIEDEPVPVAKYDEPVYEIYEDAKPYQQFDPQEYKSYY